MPDTTRPARRIGFLVSDTDPGYYGLLLNALREVCEPLNVRLAVFEGRALVRPCLHPAATTRFTGLSGRSVSTG